jgi:hypothetical protein
MGSNQFNLAGPLLLSSPLLSVVAALGGTGAPPAQNAPAAPTSRGLPRGPRPPAAGAAPSPPVRPSGLLKLEMASQRCGICNFFCPVY